MELLPSQSWGRSMLREFAAKQQMLSVRHVFSDRLTQADGPALDDLLVAIDAVLGGAVSGGLLRAVLIAEDVGSAVAATLRPAVESLSDAQAGLALGLAYLPVEAADTVAWQMLRPIGLKRVAQAIDPRGSLTLRTRLFLADRLLQEPSLQTLLATTSALSALRANGCHPDWSELAEKSMNPRLQRLRETVARLRKPAIFAASLSACLRGDWAGAERRLQAGQPSEVLEQPPRLADLFAVSLLPSCDTIDAVRRLRGSKICGDAEEARFA